MKTDFDFPFPTAWTADDLTEAVPRPLWALLDFEPPADAPPARRRATTTAEFAPRYPVRSDLPPLFHIR
ncbi:hypothetical protein LDO26_17150 [Luteimonas sp. BDR2-5]|uniref:hypothetical protein n=1 Tax=Proluteimonas luteida TaxID=2878685 RepID=UPI001E5C4856|nr:hypothetical protein [Luteimonas sp. BDR2-5]MCD9029920.1 hypothetical protein [Luteimonas sp. BDR2-5]